MADKEKNWSDIQDEAQEGGSEEALNDNISKEELSSLSGDMGGEGGEPDPNRPRFGERLGDDEGQEPDSDMNYDTERM